MKACHLRTDYLKNPLGLGNAHPRFYWQCEGGVTQTAYQITVSLREGEETEKVWDTGKVASSRMTHIRYEGKALVSRGIYVFAVTLWDEHDQAGEAVSAGFEMGLLEEGDFRASWIAGGNKPSAHVHGPADCFRRDFTLGEKPAKARLYATAHGLYDVFLNGVRIEDFILAPGMTDYRKRLQLQTYDVTELLVSGNNRWEMRLSDGWFRGTSAAYGVDDVYGRQTALAAQLEMTDAGGRRETLVTDAAFRWSDDGPIRFADLKDGEIYDASKKPFYSRGAKVLSEKEMAKDMKVKKLPVPAPSDNVPVAEKEVFPGEVLSVPASSDKVRVFDFHQNLAGYPSFRLKGKKGQTVRVVCGEILDAGGHVDLSHVQEERPVKGFNQLTLIMKLMGRPLKGETVKTPAQTILFACSGEEDTYKPSFTVFGFRYAEFISEEPLPEITARAIAVCSDMEETGTFTCSDPAVNRLIENARWSMKSNFLDLPTDCPTRERLGWTGDAQIFFNTGAFFMNTAPLFKKWMKDMEDACYPNGLIPAVLPYQGAELMYKSTGSSVGWADAVYLIPWRFYLRYGDRELLKDCWPMIRKYTDYLLKHLGMKNKKEAKRNPHNAFTYEKGVHLGEWLEPEEFRDKVYGAGASHPEECTAYLYYACVTVAEIAQMMGEEAYAEELRRTAEGAKKAYRYLTIEKGALDTDRQAKLVRPLALGLFDGADREAAEKRLLEALSNYGYRVGTGFLSTPFILPVLTAAGESGTAYKVLENKERPGWLSEVLSGATTVWENWEGDLSQNHYSPGAVCEWLFTTCAGIEPAGENHFRIRPVPGGSLTRAKASYRSLYGEVISGWEKTDQGMVFTVTVPANVTCDLELPGGEKRLLSAGTHSFTC